MFHDSDLLVCLNGGRILIIDIHTGIINGKLLGHKYNVKCLTFSCNGQTVLTSSKYEAIIWDLKSNVRLQVLNLENESHLKFVPTLINFFAIIVIRRVVGHVYANFRQHSCVF